MRLFCLCCLLIFLFSATLADNVVVKNNSDFIALVQRIVSGDFEFDITLETDLDFSDDAFNEIADCLPLGQKPDYSTVPYVGTFDGHHHVIKNFIARTYDAGFISKVKDATVKNLVFDDSCVFEGTITGAVSAEILGNITIENVKVYSSFSADNYGGGFLGRAEAVDNAVIKITGCEFHGSAPVAYTNLIFSFGGFVGYLRECSNIKLILERNVNDGLINVTLKASSSAASGFVGKIYHSSNLTIIMSHNDFSGRLIACPRRKEQYCVGGYIAHMYAFNVSLTIENNINRAFHYTTIESFIGGYIGDFQVSDLTLLMNNNTFDGRIQAAELGYDWSTYLCGFACLFTLSGICDLSFTSNTNNGFLNASGTGGLFGYSGIVGIVSAFGFLGQETHFTVRMNNNVNNGIFTSDMNIKESETGFFSGILGQDCSDCNGSFIIEGNINNGIFDVQSGNGFLSAGGIVGRVFSQGGLILRNNINNGSISVLSTESSQCLVAGLVGSVNNDKLLNMSDNVNYGTVISNCSSNMSATCGLVCASENSTVMVYNSINCGTINGTNAYGISNMVSDANNIVSMGTVNGENGTYSFWKSVSNEATSLYCLNGTCLDCGENVIRFIFNETNNEYQVIDASHTLVNSLLNEEAKKKGYLMGWDNDLVFKKIINIYVSSPVNERLKVFNGTTLEESGLSDVAFEYHLIPAGATLSSQNEYKRDTVLEDDDDGLVLVPYYMITFSGEANGVIFVVADGSRSLKDELKRYLDDYVVGDLDSNKVLNGETRFNGDMNIIILRKNIVMIDMESNIQADAVNAAEVAQSINALTGIETNNILIGVELEEGYVLRIVVVLKDAETMEVVVKSVNDLVKDSQCPYGVLCFSKRAYILVDKASLEKSSLVVPQELLLMLEIILAICVGMF